MTDRAYMRDRIEWAREVLIPDLRDSGSDATADDVEMFADFTAELLDETEAS